MDVRTEPAGRTIGPALSLLSTMLSGAGAFAMAAAASSLWSSALHGSGEDGLIAWVLLAAAITGAILCIYLTAIWALTALILLLGPASRLGAALLSALRVLAPQAARRVVIGAALAGTATGLVLAPASAASTDSSPGSDRPELAVSVSSELTPTAPSEVDPDPEAAAPALSEDDEEAPLPGLTWGADPAEETPQPHDQSTDPPAPPSTEAVGEDAGPSQAPSTLVVSPGDTLWSITDDLLGPAPDDPSEIASAWPRLHEANRDVIGTDPDHLEPGQVLSVPASLSSQEHS